MSEHEPAPVKVRTMSPTEQFLIGRAQHEANVLRSTASGAQHTMEALNQVAISATMAERAARAQLNAVAAAREAGESWATIARMLGISKQGAMQKYAKRVEALSADLDARYGPRAP